MGICRRRKVRELLVRIFDFYPTDLLRGWLAAWQISASGIRKMNVFRGRWRRRSRNSKRKCAGKLQVDKAFWVLIER